MRPCSFWQAQYFEQLHQGLTFPGVVVSVVGAWVVQEFVTKVVVVTVCLESTVVVMVEVVAVTVLVVVIVVVPVTVVVVSVIVVTVLVLVVTVTLVVVRVVVVVLVLVIVAVVATTVAGGLRMRSSYIAHGGAVSSEHFRPAPTIVRWQQFSPDVRATDRYLVQVVSNNPSR